MGVEPGKGFFFPGALAIAGKSRRHVSYMQTKPPYIGLHRCIAFFFPLRSHLISLPFKKERKKIIYIYIFFAFLAAIYTLLDAIPPRILGFPEAPNRRIPSSSPRPAVVLSSLIDPAAAEQFFFFFFFLLLGPFTLRSR